LQTRQWSEEKKWKDPLTANPITPFVILNIYRSNKKKKKQKTQSLSSRILTVDRNKINSLPKKKKKTKNKAQERQVPASNCKSNSTEQKEKYKLNLKNTCVIQLRARARERIETAFQNERASLRNSNLRACF